MDTKDKNTEMIQRIIGALIAIRITTGGDYSEEISWLKELKARLEPEEISWLEEPAVRFEPEDGRG